MDTENINQKNTVKSFTVPKEEVETVSVKKYDFPKQYYKNRMQRELINKIFINEKFDKDSNILSLLKKKISSYRQQDRHKKILRKEYPIITLDETIEKLVASKLKCYYCKCKVFILYKKIRDERQWTLDRIDNSLGHHKDNVVISCLKCNLKRRTTEIDRFTFTKQLKIKKLSESETNKQETESKSGEKQEEIKKSINNNDEKIEIKSEIKIIKSEFL